MNRNEKNNETDFCEAFLESNSDFRYVLGRNVYTESIIKVLKIKGVIDDFTLETTFCGVPVVKTSEVREGALVINASGGRPLTARAILNKLKLKNLDYFSFYKHSGLELRDIVFNEGFSEDYRLNKSQYDWVVEKFADSESKIIFDKLVNFRNSLDISYLEGFSSKEGQQYFEDFLELDESDEVFVDIGCFNGFNSVEFSRLSPNFRSIYAFEPDPVNYRNCQNKLKNINNINLKNIGISDEKAIMFMQLGGSGSKISDKGTVKIAVERLDDIDVGSPTLIKMDIEGFELRALEGARLTIAKSYPRLAVCVYHNVGDFYRVPRLISEIRDDYNIYLRHYTESIYETVMFFIPRKTT